MKFVGLLRVKMHCGWNHVKNESFFLIIVPRKKEVDPPCLKK